MSGVDFDDIGFRQRDYNKWVSYGQSKTANILFAVGLDQRLRDRGIRAYAVHPGVIETELGRHMGEEDRAALQKRADDMGGFYMKSVPAGAATSVFAATAPELESQGGVYLEDCHVAAVSDDSATEGVRSYAVDSAAADRLWTLSEDMVGQSFEY